MGGIAACGRRRRTRRERAVRSPPTKSCYGTYSSRLMYRIFLVYDVGCALSAALLRTKQADLGRVLNDRSFDGVD